jgi:CDP-diacylglycerol--serine O-phosphatidyltransferase
MERGRHFSMIRGFHISDFLTLGKAACGVAGIFCAISLFALVMSFGRLLLACGFIPIAFVFRRARWPYRPLATGDLDDGPRARFARRHDLVRRGPGGDCLWCRHAGRLGLRRADVFCRLRCQPPRALQHHRQRLVGRHRQSRYFEGTPIPTSLLLVVVIAIAAWNEAVGERLWFGVVYVGPWALHPLVAMFAISDR